MDTKYRIVHSSGRRVFIIPTPSSKERPIYAVDPKHLYTLVRFAIRGGMYTSEPGHGNVCNVDPIKISVKAVAK